MILTTESPSTLRRKGFGSSVTGRKGLSGGILRLLLTMFSVGMMWPLKAQTCTSNAIVCENSKAGTSENVWQINGAGDLSIQGFTTDISVNQGGTVAFKIKTDASAYHLDIYRMGYYGGNGARKITTVNPSVALPQTQPACITDAATKLYDCGNWGVSATWQVPSTATSGIYFALAVRNDTGGASQIFFIVRNDASHSDVLYQASTETWQAYNDYGGNSLYGPGGEFDLSQRAYKVSYNRPFDTANFESLTWLFNAEYPMIRWLEANGYDVSYFTSTDADRFGSLLLNHKIYVSSGHDEYWSGAQRANVEAARNAGVNLAFFSGNEVFWKTRWENSIDGTNTPYRTQVCYKETLGESKLDPSDPPTWTGTWRDPSFSPPADGGRPENSLTGTIFMVNGPGPDNTTLSIQVPAADGKMRFWRNTSIANLAAGQTTTLPAGTLGYEWDEDLDNGFRPAGLIRMSTSTRNLTTDLLLDYGGSYGAGTATHHLTLYRAPSGALVFGAGTVQWAYGLDDEISPTVSMQQATVNLLADMGVQPGTLQAGLLLASKSTDTKPPTSTITSPTSGSTVQQDAAVTVAGTAADSGGGVVGGVEVSVDGGKTWHPANGRESWTYTFMPLATGPITILSRAVDDSGNLENPSSGGGGIVNTTVVPRTCPCNIWGSSYTPKTAAAPDPSALELGVQFMSDRPGAISGIRFYKGSGNTGTHVGHLWTSDGTLLGSVTFSGETTTGWQSATFSSPIFINSNTTYVASYSDPVGNYAADSNYFLNSGFDNAPLHAVGGSNGVFAYNPGNFPSSTFRSTNYWIDLTFIDNVAPGPAISNLSSSLITANGAVISWQTDQSSTSRVDYGTSPNSLNSSAQISSLLTSHNINLTGLTANVTYYFRVTSVNNLGGSTTMPALTNTPSSFVTPPGSVTDTTVTDFSAGTPGVNAYISATNDGEVILNPTFGDEFLGSTLAARWSATPWNTGGSGTVSGGVLAVDGAIVQATASYPAGRSIEFVATFSQDSYEHAGFTLAAFSGPWAIFSTKSGGSGIFARTNNGSTSTDTPIPGNWQGAPHRYRIDWNTSSVVYWIDGTQVATHAIAIAGNMQPAVSDYNVGSGRLVVDWIRMTPHASSATFVSRVLDAGASANWLAANWTSSTPAGTILLISVRTGNTTPADGSWTGWTPVANSGASIASFARYIQYEAQLSTTDLNQSPELDNITFTFNPGTRTTPPLITNVSAGSVTTSGATITWTTDELSTSQVNYGTTASMGSSSGTPALVTSHSITLSGLTSGTQYFYQVQSVDSNSNVGKSSQLTFNTVAIRTTAPNISNVTVNAGSGGVATISWTTDELASSQVDYGTSSSSLNLSVSNSSMVTSHSVVLTGLAAGGTYFYRISSVDGSNLTGTFPSSGGPATFTMPPGSLTDTTVSDFSAGTLGANAYISQTGNGEVILQPTAGSEFSGTALASGWAVQTVWNTGGSATVANGTLTVDGASVGTNATFGPGGSVEFVATFSGDPYEHAGFGVDFSGGPWAMFSTKDGSGLFARTSDGSTLTDTQVPGSWFGISHRFRIDWNSGSIVYSIDGTQVVSHPVTIAGSMRPLVSDYNVGGGSVAVDWMRLSPYLSPATFTSRVLDAGTSVNWLAATWTSVLPTGTAVTVSIRTGNTGTPDGTWSSFTPLSASGVTVGGSSRYVQYQLQLSTTNAAQTPALSDITITYSQ